MKDIRSITTMSLLTIFVFRERSTRIQVHLLFYLCILYNVLLRTTFHFVSFLPFAKLPYLNYVICRSHLLRHPTLVPLWCISGDIFRIENRSTLPWPIKFVFSFYRIKIVLLIENIPRECDGISPDTFFIFLVNTLVAMLNQISSTTN